MRPRFALLLAVVVGSFLGSRAHAENIVSVPMTATITDITDTIRGDGPHVALGEVVSFVLQYDSQAAGAAGNYGQSLATVVAVHNVTRGVDYPGATSLSFSEILLSEGADPFSGSSFTAATAGSADGYDSISTTLSLWNDPGGKPLATLDLATLAFNGDDFANRTLSYSVAWTTPEGKSAYFSFIAEVDNFAGPGGGIVGEPTNQTPEPAALLLAALGGLGLLRRRSAAAGASRPRCRAGHTTPA